MLLIRRLLEDPSQRVEALILITKLFWTPSNPISSRNRDTALPDRFPLTFCGPCKRNGIWAIDLPFLLHADTWHRCILPYLPSRYRNPCIKEWGRRLYRTLKEQNMWTAYTYHTLCHICGRH